MRAEQLLNLACVAEPPPIHCGRAHLVIMYLNSSASENSRHNSMSPMVGFRWSLRDMQLTDLSSASGRACSA